MPILESTSIPYSALVFAGTGAARYDSPGGLQPEVAAALLMRVVRSHAEALAGGPIAPVSVTLDVTGPGEAPGTIQFAAHVDRKTRSVVFAGGQAHIADAPMLSATAIYRILE